MNHKDEELEILDERIHKSYKHIYSCNNCDFLCLSTLDIWNHAKIHKENQMEANSLNGTDNYSCSICNFSSNQIIELSKHLVNIHKLPGQKIFEIFKKKLDSNKELKNLNEQLPQRRKYYCTECRFYSYKSNELANHEKVHKVKNKIKLGNSMRQANESEGQIEIGDENKELEILNENIAKRYNTRFFVTHIYTNLSPCMLGR